MHILLLTFVNKDMTYYQPLFFMFTTATERCTGLGLKEGLFVVSQEQTAVANRTLASRYQPGCEVLKPHRDYATVVWACTILMAIPFFLTYSDDVIPRTWITPFTCLPSLFSKGPNVLCFQKCSRKQNVARHVIALPKNSVPGSSARPVP